MDEELYCADFKGGEQELPGNYRGIALGSCVAKVMARVICEQLGGFAEDMVAFWL